jgi:DNA helicase IV
VRDHQFQADVPTRPDDSEDIEQAREQAYVDRAYRLLAEMSVRARRASDDAAERAPGDWDATVAHRHLTRRVASLGDDDRPLCFGRIDEDGGSPWYIGRRHVEDRAGDPVVVDWRAPVAIPFYRATFRDPLGLRLRRRFILDRRQIIALLDEDFDDPDSAAVTSAGGLPDPLLAELGRAREGTMHDIVATIAAEQDRIIRAPVDTPLVVQGGPGTGKTAVGLHRAAFLLYEHRASLERQGVLVVGPNRIFLAYISQVLPSLGEVAVVQTTLPGLASAWPVRAEDRLPVAELKGDPRLVAVIERACRVNVRQPDGALEASTRWGSVRIPHEEVTDLVDAALASGGSVNQQRLRFRRAVTRVVATALTDRRRDMVIDPEEIAADVRQDQPLQRALNHLWPTQSAAAVVRSLFGRSRMLAQASEGLLAGDEQRLLQRTATASLATERWTEADLPLLDEAQAQLAEPPRRFGHIVVDEAQDVSAMALRMVARRSADGRSFTILGDLAQATAPGALRDWSATIFALGQPAGATVEELTTGYRVPRQIMELANDFLISRFPTSPTTTSVRVGDYDPEFRGVSEDELADAVAEESAKLFAAYSSVAVIGCSPLLDTRAGVISQWLETRGIPTAGLGQPPTLGAVSVLDGHQAKGLEFDAVIIVEPAEFLDEHAGVALLYIAMTRAVQQLVVVHTGELPF